MMSHSCLLIIIKLTPTPLLENIEDELSFLKKTRIDLDICGICTPLSFVIDDKFVTHITRVLFAPNAPDMFIWYLKLLTLLHEFVKG